MPDQEAIITVILYGSDGLRKEHQSRVEVEFHPRIPEQVVASGVDAKSAWLNRWLVGQADGAIKDVKHSHDWRCEFCGKPAKETIVTTASWTHLTPSRMNLYVHAFCNVGSTKCRDEFDMLDKEMARQTNMPWRPQPRAPLMPPGLSLPLLACCAGCEQDDTAGPGVGKNGTLLRCSRCKMTRYCSKECQTSDWKRHKAACKAVHSLKWILQAE